MMGIMGTVTADLLNSKNEDVVKHIAKSLGLEVAGTKDEMVKAILDHQAGRCKGCEQSVSQKKTMIASGTGKTGCKNCG
jgi:rRNA maturation endonuclease Nob1